MQALVYGGLRPAVWSLEQAGLLAPLAKWASARWHRSLTSRNPFRGYAPASHDVFVVTYPKSGTNWMLQIAHQLLTHGYGEYEHIHSVVPWPDTANMGPLRGYAIPLDDPSVWRASPERKRVIKSHLSWDLIPYAPEARYIVVIRDPKDVFVSGYRFFIQGVVGGAVSAESWLELFQADGMWGSWPASTAGYWAHRGLQNVLILSFKEMKRDLEASVRIVADFLGVEADAELIERVCERSSFAYMKGIEEKFGMGNMAPWGARSVMIRRGTQGGSSELLTPRQQREIDRYCMAELERLGSDFPYAEFCGMH